MERLLASYGIKQDAASMLTDSLLDYRDTDDLKRINGAEKDDYRKAGKTSQIRNGDLLGTKELARVLGWADVKALWQPADPITHHVSLEKRSSFNPNTASWRALVAMSWIDEEAARNIVENRRTALTADIAGIVYGGGVGDPFGANAFVNLFPGQSVIITLRQHGMNWGYRMVAAHTPDHDTSPWRIESVERVPLAESLAAPDKLVRLPELAQLRDPAKPLQLQLPF